MHSSGMPTLIMPSITRYDVSVIDPREVVAKRFVELSFLRKSTSFVYSESQMRELKRCGDALVNYYGYTARREANNGPGLMPQPPGEMDEIPQSNEVTILSAGPNLPAQLQHWRPRGSTIAVNGAAGYFPCDLWIAYDGFFHDWKRFPSNDPICVTGASWVTSILSSRWFCTDRIGIPGGSCMFSLDVALRLTEYMGATRVWIAGHDCVTGPDVSGIGNWQRNEIESMRLYFDDRFAYMRSRGIAVHRVQSAGDVVTVDGVSIR